MPTPQDGRARRSSGCHWADIQAGRTPQQALESRPDPRGSLRHPCQDRARTGSSYAPNSPAQAAFRPAASRALPQRQRGRVPGHSRSLPRAAARLRAPDARGAASRRRGRAPGRVRPRICGPVGQWPRAEPAPLAVSDRAQPLRGRTQAPDASRSGVAGACLGRQQRPGAGEREARVAAPADHRHPAAAGSAAFGAVDARDERDGLHGDRGRAGPVRARR